jgi:hypothetical protein
MAAAVGASEKLALAALTFGKRLCDVSHVAKTIKHQALTRKPALIWLRQDISATWLKFTQTTQDFWRKGKDMHQAVGLGAQHDDGERKRPGLILLRKPFIDGYKQIEFARTGNKPQEFAVVDASPTGLRNRFYELAGQFARQILGHTFVEQYPHSGSGEQMFGALFKKRHGLLARYGGVLLQKRIQCFAALNVIQQRPHRNARSRKTRLAAQDSRIGGNHRTCFHAPN